MRILLVEDNKSYAATLRDTILKLGNTFVDVAQSRKSAVDLLNEQFFDVVILDLEIPTIDDAFDLELEHGQAVFYHARKVAPGTPVYILTASEPGLFLVNLVRQGQSVDIWGTGEPVPTVDYYLKEDVLNLFNKLKGFAAQITKTEEVIINKGGKHIDLSEEQKRTLKVFTRSNGGVSCKIHRLGGLSDAIVLKIAVYDETGHVRLECVGKLGLVKHVDKEVAAYEAEVKHLKLGAFAPVLSYICMGLRGFSGIFYSLADEYKLTFFDVLIKHPAAAPGVLHKIREALSRWSDARKVEKVLISDVRRKVLSDENFNTIVAKFELKHLFDFELCGVTISTSCTHGDLHGGNILVNEKFSPVLIDFGDVGAGFTCLDPLTLELSMLFHPDGSSLGIAQQLEEIIDKWPDMDSYVKSNPLKEVIEYCREWAHDLGPNDESVLVGAYAFVLRQLKYETVRPEVTLRLLSKIVERISSRE